MGSGTSKCCTNNEKNKELEAKIQALEEELKESRKLRELEIQVYEQNLVVFSAKEEKWQVERKTHKEEVDALKKRLEKEEERIKFLEGELVARRGDSQLAKFKADNLVQHMKEEQARREEAVEKWKQLYLAIKTELDDLIQKTGQGERFYWGAEQGMIQQLQNELKAKEEEIETLRSRAAAMEKEETSKNREIDILRQSLRILSCAKPTNLRKNLPKSSHI